MIILPRQARDKHRKNSKKCRFLAGEGYNWLDTEGRETGIIFYRYFLNTAALEQATTRVVTLDSLQ